MINLFHNENKASFANSEPATLYLAGRSIYGYDEMLNMKPIPFDYVPHKAPRKGMTSLRDLFFRHKTPRTPSFRAPRSAVANG